MMTTAPQRVSRMAVVASILALSNVVMAAAGAVHRGDLWSRVYFMDGLVTLVAGIAAVYAVRDTRWRTAGRLMAWGGLAVGLLSITIMPATTVVREGAQRFYCSSNLHRIGLALRTYAEDSDGQFPLSFKELYPDYVYDHRFFGCPSEHTAKTEDFAAGTVTAMSSDFTYISGLNAAMPGEFIISYDKSSGNHRKQGYEGGRNVLFVDAHVEWWPVSRESEFQKRLAEQPALVESWRKSQKGKETGKAPAQEREQVHRDEAR